MNELVKEYIGKECIIALCSESSISGERIGTVTRIVDNWVEIKINGGTTEIINLDYISRFREYPRKKNGKKKEFFI